MQSLRHGLHTGDADRLMHGFIGRRLRSLLQLWPSLEGRRAAFRKSALTIDGKKVHSISVVRPRRTGETEKAKGQGYSRHACAWQRRQGHARADRRVVLRIPE